MCIVVQTQDSQVLEEKTPGYEHLLEGGRS